MKNIGKIEEECVNWNEICNLPTEKLDLWPVVKGHKVEAIELGGKYKLIDVGISGLIQTLNSAGYKTIACCSGHQDNFFRGYIMFECDERNAKLIGRVVEKYLMMDVDIDDRFSIELDQKCIIRFYPHHPQLNQEKYLEDIKTLFYDCI